MDKYEPKYELFLDSGKRGLERAACRVLKSVLPGVYIRGLLLVYYKGIFSLGGCTSEKSFVGCCLMFRVGLVM